MHSTIVIQFVTLDGVIEDPDGSGGTPFGGWAFRHGPEAVAGDKFRLGPILERGVLLFGHRTWDLFSRLWPTRTDPFSTAMNRIPKLVASHGRPDLDAWSSSSLVEGDLLDAVAAAKADRDVVVIGSTSVVRALATRDLVDEYRLLVFPTVVGAGARLFADGTAVTDLELISSEVVGPAVLSRYRRHSTS
jgi:dihydrofolate reductase